jgi:hypothetical protein
MFRTVTRTGTGIADRRDGAQVEPLLEGVERLHEHLQAGALPRRLDVRALHQRLEAVAEGTAELVVRREALPRPAARRRPARSNG